MVSERRVHGFREESAWFQRRGSMIAEESELFERGETIVSDDFRVSFQVASYFLSEATASPLCEILLSETIIYSPLYSMVHTGIE